MAGKSWTCTHCGKPTTIGDYDIHQFTSVLSIENKHGPKKVVGEFVVCPNTDCKEYTFNLFLYNAKYDGFWKGTKVIQRWALIPPSKAKAFPSYVPKPIIDDYQEACMILGGSAKASATLARRCLQGMIRNFWEVKRPEEHKGPWRLVEEIESIKDKVEPETWAAIDGVRKIGNIGAHMEKDINVIVEVDPEEAEK